MKRWWQDRIVWMMALSMVLLMLLSAVWLWNNAQREVFRVIRDGDFLFLNAVRSVEDSLVEISFEQRIEGEQGDSLRQLQKDIRQRISRSSLFMGTADNIDGGEKRVSFRLWRDRIKDHEIDGFAAPLAFHYVTTSEEFISKELDDDLILRNVFDIINLKVGQSFKENQFPGTFELHSCIERSKGRHGGRSFVDMSTGTYYFLKLFPDRSHILGMIKGEITYALITLVLTFLAFLLSYKTLQKQRRLTLLKNDLISNISHELKTPISTVKVALEALKGFTSESDAQRRNEYMQISINELDRLALLVDTVLKTSIADTHLALNMENVSLRDLVSDILRTMQLQFEKVGAKVDFEAGEDPLYVQGDRLHLTGVLYNLIDNAMKYSDGPVTIDISLKTQGTSILLEVKDDGIGIPKEYQSKVFDKFFRVPTGDVHNNKGYGLGLNYISQVVGAHHGTVKVQSEVGVGSRFSIKLPKA